MWVYQFNFIVLLAVAIGGFVIVFRGREFKDSVWKKLIGFAMVLFIVFYGVIPAYDTLILQSTDIPTEPSTLDEENEMARLLAEKEYYQSSGGPQATLETDEEYNIREYGFRAKSQTIRWDEAIHHIGQTVTVEGTVVEVAIHQFNGGIDAGGSAIFYLNMGNPFPDANRFTAIIWYEDTLNGNVNDDLTLPAAVVGNVLQITGVVVDYEGIPEIEIASSQQVRVAASGFEQRYNTM